MSVLDGNPAELTDRARDLRRTSDRIQDVIDALRGIVDDDKGKAVQALRELAEDVEDQLDRIHGRYDGTAQAITDYAVELTSAHAKAEAAYEDLQVARAEADSAQGEVSAWEHAIDNAGDSDTAQQERGLASALGALGRANDAVQEAQDRIDQARREMEQAAEDAISRIHDAIADTNEGFWDKVGEFFEDLGDFFKDIGEWIGKFFSGLVDFLQKLAAMITAILLALALLALIASLGPLGAIIAGILGGFILASILSDVLAPTPEVTPFEPSDPLDEPPSLANVLKGTTEVDHMGGENESIVKITKVLGPDGWYYTVTLPSTQEWLSRFGDKGAVNDLDSNLALMLTPAMQTQYERAVLEAIEQAGITPDDNLMLVGFSQGGIMAGHLAAYNSELGVDAVVVSGAPIDHMPIPDSVDVVSVQHDYDPVTHADWATSGPGGIASHGDNWTTISEPSAVATGPTDVGNIHNSTAYSHTLQANLDKIQSNHPDLDNYFPQEGGLPSVSTYYHWQE